MEKSKQQFEFSSSETRVITLPEPRNKSDVSLEQSIANRRSTRNYTNNPITLQDISQLLWSAQGKTGTNGCRTAPSAGALYPLKLYLSATNVKDLKIGIYKYKTNEHSLMQQNNINIKEKLIELCFNQTWIKEGAVDIIISAIYERTTIKYGDRGVRYVHLEAGHVAQNICLQATALDLGITTIGAFSDTGLKSTLNMLSNEFPLYLLSIGRKLQTSHEFI